MGICLNLSPLKPELRLQDAVKNRTNITPGFAMKSCLCSLLDELTRCVFNCWLFQIIILAVCPVIVTANSG